MLPHLCRVVTVRPGELPAGHSFAIVAQQADGVVVVFALADERSQLEARAAFFKWDRGAARRREPSGRTQVDVMSRGILDSPIDISRVEALWIYRPRTTEPG